jgi:general L-amino acid transport system substrate-binding protein
MTFPISRRPLSGNILISRARGRLPAARRVWNGLRAAALALSWVFPASSSLAQSEDHPSTLHEIKKRGSVACGLAAPAPGFAEQNEAGAWAGFDVDFCRALAAAIFDDTTKIKIVPLSAKERIGALQSGSVDLLLRGAPWTQARDAGQQVLYVAISFFGGQGFLARRKAEIQKARDMAELAVCVQQGTPQELDVADYFQQREVAFQPKPLASLDEAAKAYEAGQCNVISADVAALYAIRAKLAQPESHSVLPELIAKAPVGPIVRQGDDQWFNIVRWTHFAMLDAEELNVSSANADAELQSGNPDVRHMLGVDGDFGEGLGLSSDWAYRVIKAVGNYGEVFERNLGQKSPLNMERRQNALWSNGGLMYAPPVK